MNVNGNCTGQEFLENPHTLLLFSPYHTLLEQVPARGKMILLSKFQKLKKKLKKKKLKNQFCIQKTIKHQIFITSDSHLLIPRGEIFLFSRDKKRRLKLALLLRYGAFNQILAYY